MEVVCDIETDALEDPKNIWVVVCIETETEKVHVFRDKESFCRFARGVSRWVGHNFLGFDLGVLNRLWGANISPLAVLDTLVISRLLWYNIPGGHSLEAWGIRLGHPKDTFSDFSRYSQELENRCCGDSKITLQLRNNFRKYLSQDTFQKSILIEHIMAIILHDVHNNGFRFDFNKAEQLYSKLKDRLAALDLEIKTAFPPRTKLKREITPKATKHGTLHLSDFRWLGPEPVLDGFAPGIPFSVFEWVEFNPGSPGQIVERLNDAGWSPTEPTDSGASFKVNERNLETVSEDAPGAVQRLVERLLLAQRVRVLEEWFKACSLKSGAPRIHGTINHIGTWTHRCSHTNPNMGNVPSTHSKYGDPKLKAIAKEIGTELRSLWIASEGNVLVGCDADGIQLRIFAHYINDPEFTAALVSGDSKLGTDAHSLNARVLGVSRDQAKTFIYAFLLGAGVAKTATILACSMDEARDKREGFINRYPGLKYVREELIPRDVERGYFEGFDGRKVIIDETKRGGNVQGYVLGGYLQNGEACVMKHANYLWRKELVSNGIWFKQVNFVHDEWQTETHPEDSGTVGRSQSDSIRKIGIEFGLNCPLAGSYKIGNNWYETH